MRPRLAWPSGRPLIVMRAVRDRPDAAQRLQQLRLAVAGDPRDADDLAGADREADALDPGDAGAVAHDQALDLEHRRAWARPAPFSTRSSTLRPTISSASSSVEVSAVAPVRHHRALAHDRDVVGHRHDLAQLVGDQHDRAALVAQVAQDAEQMVGLLRRQHAGRLVQDQHLGAAEQRLEDLDPLLEADRQVVHHGVEIDLEGVFALELRDLGARPRRARRRASRRLRRRAAGSPAP